MCSKPKAPKKVEEKPVQYLRNPFLDGVSVGNEAGRSALRIDLGSDTGAAPAATPAPARTPTPLGLPGGFFGGAGGRKRSSQGFFGAGRLGLGIQQR